MSADRHDAAIAAVRQDVLGAHAVTSAEQRSLVMSGRSPDAMRGFLEKVRHASYRVTDDDFDQLRHAGMSEDEIYELTVAAIVGIACDRLDAARQVMQVR